jgi:peroxiredoxin
MVMLLMKRDLPVTAIVSVLLIFAIVPSLVSSFSGQNAPDFHLADVSKNTHSLSDYEGSIVVLDFFSVECSTCQISAKNVLVPLYNNYSRGDAKVQFISIETTSASADTISTYAKSSGITWPILIGGENVTDLYRTNGISTVFVIGPEGKIVFSMVHPLDIERLKAAIDDLLEGSANATSMTTQNTISRTTPTPTNHSDIQTAKPTQSTSETIPTNHSDIQTAKPTQSTSEMSKSIPTEATQNARTSDTSQAKQSSDAAVANSVAPSTSVVSTSVTSDPQKENGASTVLENCSIPLVQQANPCTTLQKCLLCSPSLLTPIVPSSVLAQAAAMSAEASALSQSSPTSCVVPTTACQDNTIPSMTLPAQTNDALHIPVQSVFEFSLLGLGAPMLLIGVLYLMLRRI